MNRKLGLIAVTIIILLLGIVFYIHLQKSVDSKKYLPSSPIPTTVLPSEKISSPSGELAHCLSQNLQAFLTTSPGAGNVYVTFTLKNISKASCRVAGVNFIFATYDTAFIKNITTSHIGETQSEPFILLSGQTLYSQAHYPNGPQCATSAPVPAKVTFTYPISQTDSVIFKTIDGNTEQDIPRCSSESDKTTIEIWNMSLQPITP